MSRKIRQVSSRYFTRSNQVCINYDLETPETAESNEEAKTVDKKKKLKTNPPAKSLVCPSNWNVILNNIVEMRSKTIAAVDTMGCDKCYDEGIDEKVRRFQVLVSLMLSSQTKDQITFSAMKKLRERNLSVEFIDSISNDELETLLKPVGFYRRKAEYLKKVARILKEQFDGDIPCTLEDLQNLPGVGPKMAHLTMKVAWNQVTGIAVDTHMHRICNRLKWVHQTKSPEQTRVELENWLPREHWDQINHLLVGFGQSICLPVKPKCNECLNQSICPASQLSF